ncbi:MAG: 1-(5-phosphoribosyl)-5-[(5-phosphoribosylamino)methylideneamino]imidazole-4-carboxamide isomerase [bacterium]
MLIIPAIDILDGKVVRLFKGDFSTSKIYNDSVIEQAKIFSSFGFERIHIVDLSGSKDGRINTKELLTQIKNETGMQIQFGGGIRTGDDLGDLFAAGVDYVIVGSLPFVNKNEFESALQKYDSNKIIISADVLDEFIYIKGWQENSHIKIKQHIESCLGSGLTKFLITDINKDGSLTGSNIILYERLLSSFEKINIIASGGVSSIEELKQLEDTGCAAAIVGKSIYEGKIKLKELSEFGS